MGYQKFGHKFVPIPAQLRDTIDVNEIVEFGVLCKYCKDLSDAIGSVQDGSVSQQVAGTAVERNKIVETAEAGCQLCARALKTIGNSNDYHTIISSAIHWKWSFSTSYIDEELELVLKLPQEQETSDADSLPKKILIELPVIKVTSAQHPRWKFRSVTTMSDEHINLANTWMRRCSTHIECSQQEPSWMPTRLIELTSISTVRLIETASLDAPVPYYALSYCWGKEEVLKTTNENVDDFKSRIPFFDMALTIQDTVTVVHRLGGRYLWVDSICIIQNNNEDWYNEAATMCDVYQNACLTIVALGAAGATEGLFGCRDPLAVGECWLTTDRMIPTPETLIRSFGAFYDSPLQTRGWTFQERALAPRKLFFSSYIFWECTHGFEEEVTNQARHPDETFNRRLVPLPSQVTDITFTPDPLGQYIIPDYLAHWHDALRDYTGRDLTCQIDRLVAISGVIKFLERRLGRKTSHGMWLDFFPGELLWQLLRSKKKVQRLKGAPTWSWTSLTARITLAFDAKKPFLHVSNVKMNEISKEKTTLVVRGRIFSMTYHDASQPRPRLSERERRLRALIGVGQEQKFHRALTNNTDAPVTEGRWAVDGMKGVIDCVAVLDFGAHDPESLSGTQFIPMVLQSSKFFCKDSPLVHCYGLGIKPSSLRRGYYQRLGVFNVVLDMGSRRRDRLWAWKAKVEEPIWPHDNWQTIRIV